MANESKATYRYAFIIYLLFAAFFWYIFRSMGLFIGQNFMPETATGFSVRNPNFELWNNIIATVLAVIGFAFLLAYRKLKEYVVDVGDELTRVSWSTLKDTRKATIFVIILVIVSSIFLFMADFVFVRGINFVLSFAAGS